MAEQRIGAPGFAYQPKQIEALNLISGPAQHCLLYGGARASKTFILCAAIALRALKAPGSRHLIARFRFNAAKRSIWLDTFPKMMRLRFPEIEYQQNKTDLVMTFPGGSEVWVGGLDERERIDQILGLEFATIFLNECSQIGFQTRETVRTRLAQTRSFIDGSPLPIKLKMYYDENPPAKTHWSYRCFIAKVDPDPPHRRLPDADDYVAMQVNPVDNAENLSETYLKTLQSLSPRQKKRFWEGEFGDSDENRLWSYETIETYRLKVGEKVPDLQRIVVAVDPSGTKGEDDERSDEVGIVVVGVGMDGHGYVLEDLTCKAPPAVWGRVVVTAFQRHEADAVVAEINYGGELVHHVVQTAAQEAEVEVPYIEARASRGKVVRAEPAAALYERGRVHHVGVHGELEDQLQDMTTMGYMGSRSPDRADALVWALTVLFPELVRRAADPKSVDLSVAEPIEMADVLEGW